ncbi:MAG: NUDIX hydrolase [Lachnospiraceae bacterium]|nr:NUDIX hydrolase [Lachnospiraceae bacterium]
MIEKSNIKEKFYSRYVKVYELLNDGEHQYLESTRREGDDLVCTKDDEEFKKMLPDAVSCVVVLKQNGKEDRLLLNYEYRYPAGRFLLSVPAGLLDPEDKDCDDPLITAAKREIKEETGLDIKDTDKVEIMNPFLFSTPGMTDESNGLVCAVIENADFGTMNQEGAVGTEVFDGFELLTKEDAQKLLKSGCDKNGIFYSIFTWAALMYFVNEMY